MVTLIEFVLAYYAKETRVTFHARRVQRDSNQKMAQASKAALRILKRDASHESMNFVTQREQVLCEITSILASQPGNQCLLFYQMNFFPIINGGVRGLPKMFC